MPAGKRGRNVEAASFRADRGECPCRCPELAEDVLQVRGHGSWSHDERMSDLLVGTPLDQEAQHFQFPRREPVDVARR
jgi:hypothetical protein